MTDQPENPQAYPCLDSNCGELSMRDPGMTLRDYFASKCSFDSDVFSVHFAEAMMGEPAPVKAAVAERIQWWLTAEAKYRYAFADAMLRERGK